MKKFLCLSLLAALVLAFAGCEAGLTSNDRTGATGDNDFSFSDMYGKIKTLQEELDRLNQVNNEQAVKIEQLSVSQSNSGSLISSRIQVIEDNIGEISIEGLKNQVDDLAIVGYDTWEGNHLTTSTSFSSIPSGPEVVLTNVKKGELFTVSLFLDSEYGGIVKIGAAMGAINSLSQYPCAYLRCDFEDNNIRQYHTRGILQANSSGTIKLQVYTAENSLKNGGFRIANAAIVVRRVGSI
ncbi:MAG: hypothetical protein GY754_02710 [bacterium]|nr:hypothetical protein [bacterium]